MQETNNTAISNIPEQLSPAEVEIIKTKLQEALLEQARLNKSLLEELDKNAKLIYQNMDLSMEKDRREAKDFKDEESILTTLTNVLTNNPKFINNIASALADHQDFNQRSDIDYYTLSREVELNELAKAVADHFDFGDIADWISIDYDNLAEHISYTDLACELDYSDLAANIDYEDTIDEVVREKLDELQVKNCTITFS